MPQSAYPYFLLLMRKCVLFIKYSFSGNMKGSTKCAPNEILNDHLNLEEFPLYHGQPLLFFQKNYHLWLLTEHFMGRKWK